MGAAGTSFDPTLANAAAGPKAWHVVDAYTAPNPSAISQPPVVTFVIFSMQSVGIRTLMIPDPAPSVDVVTAAIKAFAAARLKLIGLQGTT
jgi:hypothetical protein